jgi:large-conductance mechanosensitive channel
MTIKKQYGVKYLLIILLVFFADRGLRAQKTTVSATIEPSEIKIGQQAVINIKAIAPKGHKLIFPVFEGKLIEGVEVLGMLPADTVVEHEVITINQKYVVTSFDSTLYHIDYIAVLDGKDTLKTNGFGLKVSSINLSDSTMQYLNEIKGKKTEALDFDKLKIKDIKDLLSAPFVWTDFIVYFLLALLIALILFLIAAAIYLYRRKKQKGYFFKPAVMLPPHVLAMQALDEIKSKKIWQQGREKEYFTELTDTLREYIEQRYGMNSFEKTSDEILESVKLVVETESPQNSLKQILKLADLVKFAKYRPLPDENDLSLMNAYLFINQTKIEEVKQPGENGKNEENDANPETTEK